MERIDSLTLPRRGVLGGEYSGERAVLFVVRGVRAGPVLVVGPLGTVGAEGGVAVPLAASAPGGTGRAAARVVAQEGRPLATQCRGLAP